jgi:diguanylate cyclase (GGDEF)-like protein
VRGDRVLGGWMAAGLVFCVVYPFLGDGTPVAAVLYCGFDLVAAFVLLAGVRRNRPVERAGWYVLLGGLLFRAAGDVTYEVYRQVLGLEPFPSAADAFYLIGAVLTVAGVLLLARRWLRRDAAGLLDAAIVATGLGLVWWVFVIGPLAADASIPLAERLVGSAYPVLDLFLLAVVARLLTRAGRPPPSLRLVTVGVVAVLAADVAFQVSIAYAPRWEGVAVVGFILSNVTWAAAALHRSARDAGPAAEAGGQGLGRRRLALLAACTLLVPALLFVQGATNGGTSWLPIGVGAVLLFLLVLTRMSGFVSEIQRQAGQLEELAMRDELTGLPNRRDFERRLGASVTAGAAQVALLDLNGFKEVNDRHGHAVGDRLLTVVAERLRAALRDGDLVARMGGDEFAILLDERTPTVMNGVVERVADALNEPIRVQGHELLVGASVGTADGTGIRDPYELLRRADVAMYAAKGNGGRHRAYTPDLDTRAGEQAQLAAELRAALDTGQLRLVYQPIVALPEGRVVSVEALTRWTHPERGEISPVEFIPVAEETGLVVELGAWVLRTACAQAVTWRAMLGPAAPERMSVNVSVRQLAEPAFAGLVAQVLAWTGLAARNLIVEVTETAVFDGGQALRTVKELHELGVLVALDDFGTGHSSLGLLQTVPVDIIKVDKAFVDSITMAGRHAVIATALIQVSNGLGLIAVAEGVETAAQAAELHRLGYRFAQGYHFGKPAAEPDFAKALTRA